MSDWHPQQFRRRGLEFGVSPRVLANAIAVADQVVAVDPGLPPIFSLRHLAHLTQTEYGFLRAVVTRDLEDPYKVFRVAKGKDPENPRGFRIICVPDPALMKVQRWIARQVLVHGRVHVASFAYAGKSVRDAAAQHIGCQWLIKLDIRRFFESISEISAYRVFRGLGYQPLVSFELSRLCTRLGRPTRARSRRRWHADAERYGEIVKYKNFRVGHLPQGAPTSPMLSNLAVYSLDEDVATIAREHGITYSRYADDLCLSSLESEFTRAKAGRVIGEVYAAMGRVGLSPNITKTRVSPPGARKTMLGLLVDRDRPRLTREFRSLLRQHLYYLRHAGIGPAKHAEARGFVSVWGLRDHIEGLISFARHIDPLFADKCATQLVAVEWPI